MQVGSKSDRSVAMGTASATASSLVGREEVRTRSRMIAYRAVASKIGMSATWVRKLVAGSVKAINADVKQRLDELLIRELEAEIARLTHDLEMARRCGSHPASLMVGEIETHLAAARALMNGEANVRR